MSLRMVMERRLQTRESAPRHACLLLRSAGARADDRRMAKILVLAVAFMLMGTARCFGSDAEVSIPFLSSKPSVGPPASLASIGTPAAITLPEGDYAAWFPLGDSADGEDPLS